MERLEEGMRWYVMIEEGMRSYGMIEKGMRWYGMMGRRNEILWNDGKKE
jgi:hypothetical protein